MNTKLFSGLMLYALLISVVMSYTMHDLYAADVLNQKKSFKILQNSYKNKKIEPSQFKIGVVDLSFILGSISLTREARQKLDILKKQFLSKIDQKRQHIQQRKNQWQQKKLSLSQNESNRINSQLTKEEQELNQMIQRYNLDLLQYEKSLKRHILNRLLSKIEWVRKQKQYHIILDKKNVLAYHPQHDLSADVMEQLLLDDGIDQHLNLMKKE